MKRIISLLICALLLVSFSGCGKQQVSPEATLSPMEEYKLLGVPMSAPDEAEKADYSAQNGTTAQITFVFDGFSLIYRGGKVLTFTSGVYEKALSTEYTETESDDENVMIRLSVTTTESGNFLIEWSAGDYGYSLYSPDKIPEEEILSMAKSLALKTWRLERADRKDS